MSKNSEESLAAEVSEWVYWLIYENAWMVAKTGKPIATFNLFRKDGEAATKQAQQTANDLGISLLVIVSDDEGADVEFPGTAFIFYREQVILDTYLYLGSDAGADNIPSSVRDCLYGLLYGYRSDAIQQFVDWQKSRWGEDVYE